MTAANPAGPTAYAVSPTINPLTGAQVVDPNDEILPTVPQPNLPGSGATGYPGGFTIVSTQVLTALLIETRVQNRLLQDPSTANVELDMLRAEEAIAASGGVLN